MSTPYIPKAPGDLLSSKDWNTLQVQTLQDIEQLDADLESLRTEESERVAAQRSRNDAALAGLGKALHSGRRLLVAHCEETSYKGRVFDAYGQEQYAYRRFNGCYIYQNANWFLLPTPSVSFELKGRALIRVMVQGVFNSTNTYMPFLMLKQGDALAPLAMNQRLQANRQSKDTYKPPDWRGAGDWAAWRDYHAPLLGGTEWPFEYSLPYDYQANSGSRYVTTGENRQDAELPPGSYSLHIASYHHLQVEDLRLYCIILPC